MFSHLRFSKMAVALILLFAATGCGKAGKEEKTDMGFTPARPVVITADATIDADTKVTGPWFRLSMAFTNSSDTPITLFALKYTASGVSENGALVEKEGYILPSDFNYTTIIGTSTVLCVYETFGTWTAGASRTISPLNNSNLCSQTLSVIYLGSGPGGIKAKSFRYKVKVEPIGWFGTAEDAQDRYQKSFLFFTQ